MQKINFKTLQKIIDLKCTSSEIDILLYMVRYQSSKGSILNLKYNDICKELNISNQTFYNSLRKLEDKKIIYIYDNSNSEYGYYNILIYDNDYDFLEKKDFKGCIPYLNTNTYNFLYSKKFRDLTGGTKRLILGVLMTLGKFKKKVFSIKSLRKYAKVKCDRSIYTFIKTLKNWFNVSREKSNYIISLNENTIEHDEKSEKENHIWFKLTNYLHINKIKYTINDLNDTIEMFVKNKYDEKYGHMFYEIIHNTCLNHGKLIAPLINSNLQFRINNNYVKPVIRELKAKILSSKKKYDNKEYKPKTDINAPKDEYAPIIIGNSILNYGTSSLDYVEDNEEDEWFPSLDEDNDLF